MNKEFAYNQAPVSYSKRPPLFKLKVVPERKIMNVLTIKRAENIPNIESSSSTRASLVVVIKTKQKRNPVQFLISVLDQFQSGGSGGALLMRKWTMPLRNLRF